MHIKNSKSTKSNVKIINWVVVMFIFAFYNIGFLYLESNIFSQNATALSVTSRNFLTYDNPIHGFKIQYPSDWEKIEFKEVVEANRKIIVNFVSPLASPSDNFREYFIIERGLVKVPTGSLNSSINSYVTSLKFLPNYKLIESKMLSLANSPAEKLVYSYSNPQVGVTKAMDTIIIKDNKFFLFSFNSDAATYNNYLPTVQKMLDSLSFN
jgi:PsbP-like protein